MRVDRLDRWLGAALTVGALGWLWLVRTQIPDLPAEDEPGPRGFPTLLGFVLAGLGVTLAAQAKRTVGPDAILAPDRRELSCAAGTLGALLLYAFLLDKVGFLIATPAVMALTMFSVLRLRRWLPVVSLAAGFTLACWLIFGVLLGTPLPRGTWTVGW